MLYICSFQEIIPLNAGNIFGAEDNRPVSVWENIIRETLSTVPLAVKFKSFTDPPSPLKFKPHEDAPDIEDEIILESDSDIEEETYPINEESNVFVENKDGTSNVEKYIVADPAGSENYVNLGNSVDLEFQQEFSSPRKFNRLSCLRTEDSEDFAEAPEMQHSNKLTRTISGTEKIGLSWPEPPLHLLAQHVFERSTSFKPSKSFKASKSFGRYSFFKSNMIHDNRTLLDLASLAELDLESLIKRKRRPPYVRIVSKQMVGIFITVWVRRSLRRHIQNLNVSTVGVGVMGYIGNKVCLCDF